MISEKNGSIKLRLTSFYAPQNYVFISTNKKPWYTWKKFGGSILKVLFLFLF